MSSRIKLLFSKMFLGALFLTIFLAAPISTVGAQTKQDVCRGVATAGGGCTEGGASVTVDRAIGLAVNILSVLVGIAAVIMIIIGGYKYITSSGDSANVQSAKNTILYAIVGLVIVAMAQVITGFVLDKATN